MSDFSEPTLNMNSAVVRSRPDTDLREFVSNFNSQAMTAERRRFGNGKINSSVRINELLERKSSCFLLNRASDGKYNSLTSSIAVKPRELTSATSIRTKGTQD